ncbi:DUF4012 domain-containing protein [Patescibacteria group bacterium]|nr:MAG: DUF4012 domain-containing protein [Patescibacteria group bacterium]
MAKRLSKPNDTRTVRTLAALRKLVRGSRPAPRSVARVLRAEVAAPVAPPPVAFSEDRARAIARALAAAPDAPHRSPAALSIRSHVAAPLSPHLVEARASGVPDQAEPTRTVRRTGMLRAVADWTSAVLGAPARHSAELRLNPHRADQVRPDAFAARVRLHADIPAALVRGLSDAAADGASILVRPFDAAFNAGSGDRLQPLLPYTASAVPEHAELEIPEHVTAHMRAPLRTDAPPTLTDEASDYWFSGLLPFGLAGNWRRSLVAVAVIAIVALLPVHFSGAYASARRLVADVRVRGDQAVAAMRSAGEAAADRDLPATTSALAAASAAFGDVRAALGPVGGALVTLADKLPGGSRAAAGAALFTAGDTFTRAGEEIATRLAALEHDAPPTAVLAALRESVARLGPDVARAAEALAAIDPEDIPAEHRAEIAALAASAGGIRQAFADFLPLADATGSLLGADGSRRYLLVFQNQHELRPTGGFIGSFAEVTLKDGRISDVRFPPGGSYDIQGDVRAWLNPPDPLRLVAGRWRFHDANWFPDFPTSARKLSWFYEKSGGPTVDGVIAVNATVLSELLAVVGPVEMPDYGVTLTSQNVLDEVQRAIELHPADPAKPKQILADLMPLLLARLQSPSPQMSLALAELVGRGLAARRIQISVDDPAVAGTFASFGWDGALKQTDGDYLDVVVTNIGGEKTDAVIRDDIMHEIAIAHDGRVTDTVTMTRTHRGRAGVPMTGTGNYTYLRMYVPEGSALVSADGDFEAPRENLFIPREERYGDDPEVVAPLTNAAVDRASGTRVYEELGKTVFANWMRLLPGESKMVRFTYELPFRVTVPERAEGLAAALAALSGAPERGRYTLLLQKQSGAEERYVTVRVRPPQGMRPLAALPDELTLTESDARLDVWHQETDRFLGVLFGF